MSPFPFTFGPSDDWDPQGYTNGSEEEELEDELITAGMSVKTDDEDEDDVKPVEEAVDDEVNAVADDEEDAEEFEEVITDPLAALDDLADQVNRTERETLRFKGDFDE
ncbi:MAG: hypothetical protein PHS79_02520 [Patescibacteria group bacterium]|nr:hypothetical protein [Patescibacteria group bacterium]